MSNGRTGGCVRHARPVHERLVAAPHAAGDMLASQQGFMRVRRQSCHHDRSAHGVASSLASTPIDLSPHI